MPLEGFSGHDCSSLDLSFGRGLQQPCVEDTLEWVWGIPHPCVKGVPVQRPGGPVLLAWPVGCAAGGGVFVRQALPSAKAPFVKGVGAPVLSDWGGEAELGFPARRGGGE